MKHRDDKTLLYGRDLFGDPVVPSSRGKISNAFIMPPFSVLNTRDGYWQERKRAWLSMGIKGESGRQSGLNYSTQKWVQKKNMSGACGNLTDTSVFDPVLCELVYRWFSMEEGMVLDPFAGGSVRGVVAGALGRNYYGIELRGEQVAENRQQCKDIVGGNGVQWVVGDSENLLPKAPMADLVFSCPPYGDLEVYSDDVDDLSNMDHVDFMIKYRCIIASACARLKDNRFACFVVGEYRDKKGNYTGLVPDTIKAFTDCGLGFYNECILVTSVGSLPIRIAKQFDNSRKIGKCHQNVLIFIKGDPKKAAQDIS